ncbi:MAG: MBL fold metallo-hydrolase [Cyclobacteriaceae bacterium]|nr:MBL fold metallo-hydrolase [Cyclobacteriaceae bacterium]
MQIKCLVFNPFQENTYVVYDETGECLVIDPGCYDKEEQHELTAFIEANGLTVKLLLNTHCHIDHVLGNHFVKEKYNVNLLIEARDEVVLNAVKAYAPNYGFHQYAEAHPDGYLLEGETVSVGHQEFEIIFVPGHSPGHVAFYNPTEKVLIGGDVLFRNSIGRTDLPGGNFDILINSIHQKLFTLPNDVTVYPGHGEATTIGYEKKNNPFCALPLS